jgi:ubiquinone/menaquinone biosynthesis C-methylase UbiE
MKNNYWAKKKYSQVDPEDYVLQRFITPAGKFIDEVEKRTILDLLIRSGIEHGRKSKLLDVATGPGRLAFYLEDHLRKTEITGVDINENMLKRARKIAKVNKSKIHFLKGDIYNLPFQDGQFDIIVGLRFSMHLPQIDKVIKEFSRVLKGGGILIFDIFNYHSILQLRLMNSHNKKEACGFYTKKEIVTKANKNSLEFLSEKGILLFGETILRFLPHQLLNFAGPMINPPFLLKSISSKLVLSFRKNI